MKKKIILFVFVLSLISLINYSFAIEEEVYELYPTTISELSARVTLFGKGNISGLKEGEEVNFQTITFKETPLQRVKIVKQELILGGTTFYPKIIIDKFDNKYASFTLTKNGDFEFEITADINTISSIPKIVDTNITTPNEIYLQYTNPSDKIESDSSEIINLVNNNFSSNSFIDTLSSTILWVNDYVEYARDEEFNKYYLQQRTAVETLLVKKGVCDEFSNLAAAILRAKKIPTRIVIGITFDGRAWGNHAWVETYNEKQDQWISSDPTFREIGFVDATHIRLGSFDDISNSIAKATHPTTTNLIFDTQSQLPNIEISSIKYFDIITITSTEQNLVTKNWNKIKLKIKNNSPQKIITPLIITKNYSELLFKETKQTIQLDPNEEKEVYFEVYPKIDLELNQIAQGELNLNSLSKPAKIPIQIKQENKEKLGGELIIDNITPIISENYLLLQLTLKNFFDEDKEIEVTLKSEKETNTNTKLVPKLSTIILEEKISLTDLNQIDLLINTKEKNYFQTIVIEQKNLIIQKPVETPNIIEQKIDSNNPDPPLIQLNSLMVLTIILIIIGVLLTAIFWFNKKYV